MLRAVILAAGRGTRMQRETPGAVLRPEQAEAARAGFKGLIPIAGRPFLDHVLEEVAEAGARAVCLVVSPDGRAVWDSYRRGYRRRAPGGPEIELAVQQAPRGTADALLAAEAFTAGEDFLLLNSDNLYPAPALRQLAALPGAGVLGLDRKRFLARRHSNIEAERMAAYALLDFDDSDGAEAPRVRRILEKPSPEAYAAWPEPVVVSVNAWRLTPEIFSACRRVPPSQRGELELPQAALYAIDHQGLVVRAVASDAAVLDLSHRGDIPAVERLLSPSPPGNGSQDSTDSSGSAGSAGSATSPLAGPGESLGEFLASADPAVRRLAERLRREGAAEDREALACFVPGRVEVLGKHTDYAGGRSLTCAAEQGFRVLAAPRADERLRLFDLRRGVSLEISVSGDLSPTTGWANYPTTLVRRLARNFPSALVGADIAFTSDLPAAAGMSSSSALMIALYLPLAAFSRLEQRPEYRREIRSREDLAGYLGTVENGLAFGGLEGDGGVGVFGGSEDQTAILGSREGFLGLYRYAPVERLGEVALPAGHRFAIAVSGVRAAKAGAARQRYNRASRLAAAAAEAWRVATGRDEAHLAAAVAAVGPEAVRGVLRTADGSEFPPEALLRRFEHFHEESEVILPRVFATLRAGDLAAFGEAVDRSQADAEALLDNQIPETVFLAREARHLGAAAASAFGGGYGGSVWALAHESELPDFLDRWAEGYHRAFPHARDTSSFLSTSAASPARRLRPDTPYT